MKVLEGTKLPTSQLPNSLRILYAGTVSVLNNRNALPHPLHKLDNLPQSLYQSSVAIAHRLRPTMHRQRADSRIDYPLHELQSVLLRGQKTDLRCHGDLWGHCCAEGGENGAEEVWIGEEGCTHPSVCRERLGAAAVEVDARDVLHDRARGLDRQLWVRCAYLEDVVWLFDGVSGEYGSRFAVVRDDAGYSCVD